MYKYLNKTKVLNTTKSIGEQLGLGLEFNLQVKYQSNFQKNPLLFRYGGLSKFFLGVFKKSIGLSIKDFKYY